TENPLRVPRTLWLTAAWIVAIAVSFAVVRTSGYALRDPDSTLYESISQQLAKQPLSQWINPQWPEGRFKTGPFQEHLAVFFWPAAALNAIGFERGALLFNLLSLAGLCLALELLVRRAFPKARASGLASALFLISPWGIQYALRANHELPWAAFSIAALAMLFHPRARTAVIGFALFAAAAFLIKGVLAALLLPLPWVLVRRKRAVASIMTAVLVIGLVATVYELLYRRETGAGFFTAYAGAQLGYIAKHEGASPLVKALNLLYYPLAGAWFCLPATVAIALLAKTKKRIDSRASALLVAPALWLVPLALMSRHAVRYAFPPMMLLHVLAAHLISRTKRVVPNAELIAPALLVVIVPLRCALDPLIYRPLNFG
ncbi:MAG: hypothetical protein ACJ790_04395, partial [Myxococcaceae bacterium]